MERIYHPEEKIYSPSQDEISIRSKCTQASAHGFGNLQNCGISRFIR